MKPLTVMFVYGKKKQVFVQKVIFDEKSVKIDENFVLYYYYEKKKKKKKLSHSSNFAFFFFV